MYRYFLLIQVFLLSCSLNAQVYVKNGFFEGEPQDATVPSGWHICAPGSTPDILPGPWGVFLEPSEGETYIGMITREDGSYESIGQRLSEPLQPGQCYELKVDLAYSRIYAGYKGSLRLRIWGGLSRCGQDLLLFESPEIDHGDWRTYTAKFTADAALQYIVIEAYSPAGGKKHTGNILIDKLQGIGLCTRA